MRLIIVVENQCAIDNLGEGIREVRSTLHETSQPDDLQATHEHSTGRPPGR